MEKKSFFWKLSALIVKGRYLLLALFAILTGLAAYGMTKTVVNYDITSYLPASSETRRALDIMEKEFAAQATTDVMVKDLSRSEAEKLKEELAALDAVAHVDFNSQSSDYYSEAESAALYTITLADESKIPAKRAVAEIRELLVGRDIALRGDAASDLLFSEMMQQQMLIILLIAVVVILTILTLTSKSFFEIPIFIAVFAVAALLNMGTNFLLGSISFVTNSIAVVLQLALAIDYAIILAHRFADELKVQEPTAAVVSALAKSMPSILASSLTTVSGLIAIMFMQFKIGLDIGLVLTKGIVFSFLTVFLLMPCLLLFSAKLIKKSTHRSFVPSVEKPVAGVMNARRIIPIVGLLAIAGGCVAQSFTRFGYDTAAYPTSKTTTYAKNVQAIEKVFGRSDMLFGIIVEKGDYQAEDHLTAEALSAYPEVLKSGFSLGYLTGGRDPFTALGATDLYQLLSSVGLRFGFDTSAISESAVSLLVSTYNLYVNQKFSSDPVYLFDQGATPGFLTFLAANLGQTSPEIARLAASLPTYLELLVSEAHSRLIFTIDAERYTAESPEIFEMIRDLRRRIAEDESLSYQDVYLFGDMVSYFDISESFTGDRLLVSLLTVVCIFVILLISFRSISLPVVLLLTIQGAIWINFGIYAITKTPMLFLSYLLVSAIHMGATIDYAIVITNRYREFQAGGMAKVTAGVQSVTASFTTIMTSAAIMTIAGFIIAGISTEPYIFTVGMTLGSGTLISLIMVLLFLPTALVACDKLIERTTWSKRK